MGRRIYLIFAIAALLSGCNKALEDLVRISRPVTNTIVPFEGQAAIKISPGNTVSVGDDISMRAHVTVTDRMMNGGDLTARVSISRPQSDKTP